MPPPDWASVLAAYGRHLHEAAGPGHHVVSPLGAWLVVALCGGLSETDPVARTELAEVLQCDPIDAAAFASALVAAPHPLVATGAGLWVRSHMDTARVARWRAGLPGQVDTGDIPSQEKLDRWAYERTLGLIQRFPLEVPPDAVGVLASALATKVSWEVPFEVVEAAELGPSRWGRTIASVLKTPADPRHRQFLTDTATAGPVAVHLHEARGGLLVGSVIAADGDAPAGRVLAEAERIVIAEARRPGAVTRLSLGDLPLGAGPVWDITEDPGARADHFGPGEPFTTIMPAWSATSEIDLSSPTGLGFGVAAGAMARALELSDWYYAARQSAVARYNAVGFEAAAVSALVVLAFARAAPPGVPRRAVVRFRHPYAVLAVTRNDPQEPSHPSWHALPVFSAWVTEADNAQSHLTGG